MKFRKKPVVIEAIQFTGTKDNYADIARLSNSIGFLPQDKLLIKTLEGNLIATIGDWIIKGVKGECYPCRPDIFQATYEPIVYQAGQLNLIGEKR